MAERWEPPFERGQILVERRAEQKNTDTPCMNAPAKYVEKNIYGFQRI